MLGVPRLQTLKIAGRAGMQGLGSYSLCLSGSHLLCYRMASVGWKEKCQRSLRAQCPVLPQRASHTCGRPKRPSLVSSHSNLLMQSYGPQGRDHKGICWPNSFVLKGKRSGGPSWGQDCQLFDQWGGRQKLGASNCLTCHPPL